MNATVAETDRTSTAGNDNLEPPRQPRRTRTLTIVVVAIILITGAALVLLGMAWATNPPTAETTATTAIPASADTSAVVTISTDTEGVAATEVISTTGAATDGAVATGLTDVSDIAAAVVDSVVTIDVTVDVRGPFDLSASGSGVVVGANGTIVTNAHVVDDATSVSVTLSDGSTLAATVLGIDSTHDLAMLRVEAVDLTPVTLGSTDGLEVGEPVIAVGNPLGLDGGPSVTTGIVSALGRVLEDTDVSLHGVVQTDAAITEGSSGGALFDGQGRLIGVTTAIGVSSVGVEGIGFAIPVETVTAFIADVAGA